MNLKSHFKIILIFLILTVILTFPLIFNMNKLVGQQEDNMQTVWNFWHVKKALQEEDEKILYTNYLFYPKGTSLVYHTLTLYNSFISVPLQLIFTREFIYNLLMLLTFVLAGYGMYLLCFYLTKNTKASILGGIIFAFSPYHMAHAMHHLNLSSIQFIPFSVLFFFKFLDTNKLKFAIITSIFLILNFYCCYIYTFFLFLFFVIVLVYRLFVKKKKIKLDKRFIINIIVLIVVLIVAILPVLYPMAKEGKKITISDIDEHNADLLSFFTPSYQHPVFKSTIDTYKKFSEHPWEAVTYLGYLVIILSIVALVKLKVKQKWFWGFCGLFFLVLSFGTNLQILGKAALNIKLPYYWLMKIPYFTFSRIPSRFVLLFYFSLAVLIALYIAQIMGNKRKRKSTNVIFFIILIIIIFEYMAFPVRISQIPVPDSIKQLEEDKEDYAVLNLPLGTWVTNELYMYYQTIHNKRILSGAVSHTLTENTLLQNISIDNLKNNNIKYIIVHKRSGLFPEQIELIQNVTKDLKIEKSDEFVDIFKI